MASAPSAGACGASTSPGGGGGKTASDPRPALVAFGGRADRAWLRLLRPGFRHCLVAVAEGDGWIVIDPLLSRLEVRRIAGSEAAVARRLRALGLTVVRAQTRPAGGPLPPGLFTCVELVKRALGLRAPMVLTPRQLHRRLIGDSS